MKAKDLSTTAMLGIAGALMIVAAISILFMQPETLNTIARQIGLQDQAVGPGHSETEDPEAAIPPGRKGRAKRSATSSESGGKGFFEAPRPSAKTDAERLQASSPGDVKPEAGSSVAPSPVEPQRFIKATSIEQGHLLEKYMYLDGAMVLYVDGHIIVDAHVLQEHLAQDRR